jgi:hypothetical protein
VCPSVDESKGRDDWRLRMSFTSHTRYSQHKVLVLEMRFTPKTRYTRHKQTFVLLRAQTRTMRATAGRKDSKATESSSRSWGVSNQGSVPSMPLAACRSVMVACHPSSTLACPFSAHWMMDMSLVGSCPRSSHRQPWRPSPSLIRLRRPQRSLQCPVRHHGQATR